MKFVKCIIFSLLALTGQQSGGITAAEIETDTVLIENVRVWDGNSNDVSEPTSVLVESGLIKTIGSQVGIGHNGTNINGNNRVLMPGIIEAHTHISMPMSEDKAIKEDPSYVTAHSIAIAEGILMRGWTTIRDMGGPSQGIAKAIDEGIVPGPRIYTAAMFISQTSGHGDSRYLTQGHPNMGATQNSFMPRRVIIADGPDEVMRAVRESLRVGATAIKVMAGGGISSDYDPLDSVQYTFEEMRAAVIAAEQWNTYVAVHAYTDEAVVNALNAGVKVIEHGHLLSKETLRLIKKKGAYLSTQSFGFFNNGSIDTSTNRGKKAQMVFDGIDKLMKNAKELEMQVAFGTDSFGLPSIFANAPKEFGYRLKWFNSLEILKQATSFNAKLLELTGPRNPYVAGPLGVIEEGAYADLLIVDGNPLNDIRLLEDYENNIKLIMKNGVVYKNTL